MPITGKGTLSRIQTEALRSLSSLADAQHFYLTGGTARAEYYLGHRKSYDLDLFTAERTLVLPFSRLVEEAFSRTFSVKLAHRFETFVEFEIGSEVDSVRVQFLHSPARRLLGTNETGRTQGSRF